MEGRTKFGLVGTHPPVKILPIVFSNDPGDNVNFPNTPAGYTVFARAFIPFQTGTVRLVFHDDTTFDKPVIANTLYIVTVKRFNATGTVGVTSGEMQN